MEARNPYDSRTPRLSCSSVTSPPVGGTSGHSTRTTLSAPVTENTNSPSMETVALVGRLAVNPLASAASPR
jgi:hypothetical protein